MSIGLFVGSVVLGFTAIILSTFAERHRYDKEVEGEVKGEIKREGEVEIVATVTLLFAALLMAYIAGVFSS